MKPSLSKALSALFGVAALTIAALGTSAPAASASASPPSARALVTSRARVVRISATSVILDVFTTGATVAPGAEVIPGHRIKFDTRGATLDAKSWSSSWRSVRRDTMLSVTVAMTAKDGKGTCSANPDLLGEIFCNSKGRVSELGYHAKLELVSASTADGYCATVSARYNGLTKKWGLLGVTYRANVCFFTVNGAATGTAYLNMSHGVLDDGAQVLADDGKGLYFGLPVSRGEMMETRLDRLPPRGSKIKIALSIDFADDGFGSRTSPYKSAKLPS